eukprot:1158037-Pelagomonas_calceolata.AAC.2
MAQSFDVLICCSGAEAPNLQQPCAHGFLSSGIKLCDCILTDHTVYGVPVMVCLQGMVEPVHACMDVKSNTGQSKTSHASGLS